jgi:hypothetical protein
MRSLLNALDGSMARRLEVSTGSVSVHLPSPQLLHVILQSIHAFLPPGMGVEWGGLEVLEAWMNGSVEESRG